MKAKFLKINLLVAILFSFNVYSQVVINEVMARPSGNQGLINFGGNIGREYIELYNKSCSAIDISGYFIGFRQDVLGTPTGGSFRIPNGTLIPSNGHLVIGTNLSSTDPASIDIQITSFTSNYCQNNATRNFLLANIDGWVALYNASGTPIDAVYWATNSSNISQSSDFGGNPCIPAGSPASVTTLQSAIQINTNFPGMLKYAGPNPSNDLTFSRNPDGGATWQSLATPTINHATGGANANCNFGACVPIAAPPAPIVTSPLNYCQGATAVPLTATPSAGGTLNWYGTSATGGTASPTAPTPSTATVGSTTYYVSQTIGGCESPRAAIVVNVNTSWSSIISCGTSTASSVTFDWTFANFATGYSISYQVNTGSPINIGSIGNVLTYTVNSLNSGDNVTITVTPLGGSVNCFTSTTSSCATIINNSCGVCDLPSCPIIGVANYSLRNFSAGSCSTWSPSLTNSVVKNYYLVQADANGFVGLIQQANGSPALCISRSAILRPLATSCNVASNVSPSVVNANGVASGFNPEWYGLTPNAQYIIEVTIILGVGCTLDSLCSNYYGCTIPSAPTASATIQPTCTTPTGTIVVSSPTGVGNLYSIDGINFQPSPTFSGLAPNTYTVIVKKTPSGCTSSATNITINAVPTITAPTASATAQPTCTVGTGTIVVSSPIGANFEYSINGTTFQTSPTFSGLTPNTYNVIVKNLTTGCISIATIVTINSQPATPNVPTILSVAPTCLAAGSSSISNYVTGITYVFNPSGPSVAVGGAISGMVTGTNYAVSASNGSCTSSASASFSNVAQLTVPATPTISSVAPTCSSSGSSSISNYVAGITYVFNPAGPSVAVGGAISGMVTGTNYTVSASNGSCSSVASANIVINAQPVTPVLNYTVTNTVCNGSTLNFVLNSNVTNTNFSWSATVSNISGFYSTTTNGDESNINNLVALTNPEAIGTITMVIIPRANGCDGIPQTVIITVNPNPVVEVVAVADTSVCSATSATNNVQVNISGNISGITYNWTAITNGVTVVGGTTSGTITATSTTASFGLQVITSNPLVAGTIYFEVSAVRNGCVGNTLQSAVVTVNPNPGVAISSPDKTICSGDPTDLMIDVSPLIAGTEIEWEVLTEVNVSGANPGSGIAPQPINDVLTSTTGGYVIYRVRTSLGECAGSYTDYRVNVNPAPLPILTDGNICITADGEVYQNYTLNTGLSNTDYDFEWFDSNGNIIPGETNATLVVDAPGTYSVIATNWLTGCSSDPTLSTATATVTETMPATTMSVVQSDYFSDNATITVNVTGGSGTLLYSIDEGSFQSSNVFTGVSAGEHLVTVVDTEGCTYLTQEVTIIDYPNYFTPNGDGINDTWNISGLNQPGAKLYIFDRYGKLIKQLSATDDSEGWDGTYNQEQLPSTDYWFSLDYMENGVAKTFKAHFTMKR